MSLDATVGGADTNSYATLEEAEAYMATRLFTTLWASPTVTIGAGANGVVTITATIYGAAYTVAVVAGVGADVSLSATLVGQALTVTLGTDGAGVLAPAKNTALLVAAVIDALAAFTASASGTGATIVPVTATTAFDNTAATKEAALIWAARLLDSSFVWTGTPVDEVQAMGWPRAGMLTRNGFAIATTTIPRDLKYAQIELARQLVIEDRSEDNDALKQGISSVSAGSVSVSFRDLSATSNNLQMRDADLARQGPQFDFLWKAIPDAVRNLLPESWYTRATLASPFMFAAMR